MKSSTAFYIIEGEGKVFAAGEECNVNAGSVIQIGPGLARQIQADSRLVVLAIQYE